MADVNGGNVRTIAIEQAERLGQQHRDTFAYVVVHVRIPIPIV
jgi:hypothetical protein